MSPPHVGEKFLSPMHACMPHKKMREGLERGEDRKTFFHPLPLTCVHERAREQGQRIYVHPFPLIHTCARERMMLRERCKGFMRVRNFLSRKRERGRL